MKQYQEVEIRQELPDAAKLALIGKFEEWYSNTDQDERQFAREFLHVVRSILDNNLPVRCRYLAVEEVLDELFEILPADIRADVLGK